jgi:serine/threonine protein kinase
MEARTLNFGFGLPPQSPPHGKILILASTLCKNCGKEPLGTHAGSVTSYFFRHNFCQCSAGASGKVTPPRRPDSGLSARAADGASSAAGAVCASCGKSKKAGNRLGSLTSFLFQDLKCECGSKAEATRRVYGSHTQTATRASLRKQFTENLKNKQPALVGFAANSTLENGTIVGGVYSILSLVGVGGMGCVYLAEHPTLHKKFALKVMWPGSVNQENWSRFKAEAQTIASLNHPTFVKVYDLGLHENQLPYYAMDYLNGRSLEEVLIDDGPLSELDAIEIYIELLDGLAYAHRNGIIHRDLKPANIMLCSDDGANSVKILDFGISKLSDSASLPSQHLTVAGDVFGSPFYMSPEQCAGEKVDARADIYSLGCSLFETLTGYVPFEGTNSFDTMVMHQEDEPPQLDEISGGLQFSAAINLVISKCLAKSPEQRYQSAKELALDLARVKEGRDLLNYSRAYPLSASSAGTSSPDRDDHDNVSSSPNRMIGRMAAVGLLLAVSAGGIWFWSSTREAKTVEAKTVIEKPSSGSSSDFNSAASGAAVDSGQAQEASTKAPPPIIDDRWIENADKEIADCERRYGPDHPLLVNKLTNLAYACRNQANYKKSEVIYKRIVDIYTRKLGPDHKYLLTALNEVADSCENQGKFAEAEGYYKRVLSMLQKRKDTNPQVIASQLNILATLYRVQKKFDLAEPLYKRSIALDPVGNWSTSTRTARQNYCFLLRESHRDKEADQLEKEKPGGQPTYHDRDSEGGELRNASTQFESIDEFLK